MKPRLKNILIVLPFFFSIISCKEKKQILPATHGTIAFIDTIHNFGSIPLDNPIDTFDFRFINVGENAMLVLNTKPSCECTTATYDHIPVLPGDTSFIRVIYDGTGKEPQYFNKTVAVTTTAAEQDIILTIEGELTQNKCH